MVKDDVSQVCASGAGAYSKHSNVWARRSCGHLDDVGAQDFRLFVLFLAFADRTKSRNQEKSGVLFLPCKLVLQFISVVTMLM